MNNQEKTAMMPKAEISRKKQFSLSKIIDLFRKKRKKDKEKSGEEDAARDA